MRGRGSSAVERATPGDEVPGSIPAVAARSPTGWVGVSIMLPAETEVMVSQLCLMCGSTLNCLGARPRYNLVVDEDIKKPTNQTITCYLQVPVTSVSGISPGTSRTTCSTITSWGTQAASTVSSLI